MSDTVRLYWLYALTPVHVGVGRGVGVVDLPVARERATNWPVIPGSGLKGVMRDALSREGWGPPRLTQAFGSEVGSSEPAAGALAFTDARLVALPVRSFYGTFAYAVSPLSLQRLGRDLRHAGLKDLPVPRLPSGEGSAHEPLTALVPPNSVLGDPAAKGESLAYLEDLDVVLRSDPAAQAWAQFLAEALFDPEDTFRQVLTERLAVVPDNVFQQWAELAMEVQARVRLEDSGTVAPGGLWYVESVPAEAVFAGLVTCDRLHVRKEGGFTSPRELLDTALGRTRHLQVGGEAGVGRGLVKAVFQGGGR